MKTAVSFEFFPPRTDEQRLVLQSTWQKLAPLAPEYLSVTFGAAGSSQDATRDTVLALRHQTDAPVVPHLTCMLKDRDTLRAMLADYRQIGVDRLVVLRGDKPEGVQVSWPFQHANELIAFIREETGDHFHIEVGCYPELHPESPSAESEVRWFKAKVEAGANGAITQYFYNADAYFRFVDECLKVGVDIPIRPGIMPITNYRQLARFSQMCGAEIPRWIAKRLEGYGDDGASIRAFGMEVVTQLCDRLKEGGAPGFHMYTLNRANASMRIWQHLAGGP
jgi:methylenetetrahydrofolate reductase (NADPH)